MTIGRRERQKAEMRARLLESALELFATGGYDETTIDRIAERADVARQTVLNHYPRKRAFVEAWAQGRRDRVGAIVPEGSPRERLHRVYAEFAAINERERKLTQTLFLRADTTTFERPVPSAVRDALTAAGGAGDLRRGVEPGSLAEVLTAVYFDTLSRWLSSKRRPFDLARTLTERIDLVLDGALAH